MAGEHTRLFPAKCLQPIEDKSRKDTALIILNSPLEDFDYVNTLYNHASYRLCADGGANRLHDLLGLHHPTMSETAAIQSALPDSIHGDLDSLRSDVRERYTDLGVEVTQDPDQYSTDFGKGIKKVIERMPDIRNICVLGSLGGRIDQGIGLLHELYREQKFRHPQIRFWLFTEASVSTVLSPGTTTLETRLGDGLLERNMGILPLYGPACITTSGLEWDVSDWPTEMGHQVSTSNHVVADAISITTDREVLFTIERNPMRKL